MVYLKTGETHFTHLFTVKNDKSTDLRVGVDIFPNVGIELYDIKFLLIPKNSQKEPNTEPTANAGQQQTVTSGDLVTLMLLLQLIMKVYLTLHGDKLIIQVFQLS